MKKWFVIPVAGMMAVMLGACNDETAEEVYEKAVDASEEMEGADVTLELQQHVDSDGDQPAMNMDSDFDVQMTMDPLTMHMDGTAGISMAEDDAEDAEGSVPMSEQNVEIYMVDDNLYMYNEQMGNWLQINDVGTDILKELGAEQPDPAKELALYDEHADEFTIEENGDVYTLALEAEGEEFEDLFQKILEEGFTDEYLDEIDEEEQKILESAELNGLSVEMDIDQDEYDVVRYFMDMDVTMEEDGEDMDIAQTLDATYSNINDVDPIEVPDDVKENTVEQ